MPPWLSVRSRWYSAPLRVPPSMDSRLAVCRSDSGGGLAGAVLEANVTSDSSSIAALAGSRSASNS